jgi:hypothetical protein
LLLKFTPEMLAALEEAKKAQSLMVTNAVSGVATPARPKDDVTSTLNNSAGAVSVSPKSPMAESGTEASGAETPAPKKTVKRKKKEKEA